MRIPATIVCLLATTAAAAEPALLLVDRSASPPSEIRLAALTLSAEHVSAHRPIAFRLAATLQGSTRPDLDLSGTVHPAQRPGVDLEARVPGADLARLLVGASNAGFLTGTLEARTRLAGRSEAWSTLSPALSGAGDFRIRDGVVRDFNPAGPTLRAAMALPAVTERKVMEVLSRHPNVFGIGDTPFSEMVGRVEIRDAAIFVRDFVLRTAEYDLVGDGRYGFDGAVDFRTSLVFSPKLSAELIESTSTMRYLRNRQDRVVFPVGVRGTTAKLAVAPDVQVLATAASREALRGAVDRALDLDEDERKPRDPEEKPSSKELGRDILRRGIDELLRP